VALTATLYSARVDLADQNRNLYERLSLKLALHPSEQPERLIARLLAYCLHAEPDLQFGKGLSSDDADIWLHDASGELQHWIDVGEPDAAHIKKASRLARRVTVLAYTRSQQTWWQKQAQAFSAFANVNVLSVDWDSVVALAQDLPRQIHWQLTIADDSLYVSLDDAQHSLQISTLQSA